MKNGILLHVLCFIGVLENCSASLSVSIYASEGTSGLLQCNFYIQKSSIHVVWYREENINITTCNYPGHCELPLNPRYEAFINSQSSTFAISEASYYKDDGRWYCKVNGLESSVNFTVTSIPSSFRFTSPQTSGSFIPDDGTTLNVTATCLYPKPNIVNLQYRIQGDKHYINFTRREADIRFLEGETSRCLKHQKVMIVTIVLYNKDFHFERDTSVLFQFSYKLQTGKEKNTEEVIDVKFSGNSSDVQITIDYPDPTTTTIHSSSEQTSLSDETWVIIGVIIFLVVVGAGVGVVCLLRKRKQNCSSCENDFCKQAAQEDRCTLTCITCEANHKSDNPKDQKDEKGTKGSHTENPPQGKLGHNTDECTSKNSIRQDSLTKEAKQKSDPTVTEQSVTCSVGKRSHNKKSPKHTARVKQGNKSQQTQPGQIFTPYDQFQDSKANDKIIKDQEEEGIKNPQNTRTYL